MKSAFPSLLLILTLSMGAPAWADCAFPKAPASIPDGKSSSEPDMIEAMHAFKEYNTEVESYLSCLDSETDAKTKDPAAAGVLLQFRAMQQKKRSSALEEREAKLGQFNEQVRIFKARKS